VVALDHPATQLFAGNWKGGPRCNCNTSEAHADALASMLNGFWPYIGEKRSGTVRPVFSSRFTSGDLKVDHKRQISKRVFR